MPNVPLTTANKFDWLAGPNLEYISRLDPFPADFWCRLLIEPFARNNLAKWLPKGAGSRRAREREREKRKGKVVVVVVVLWEPSMELQSDKQKCPFPIWCHRFLAPFETKTDWRRNGKFLLHSDNGAPGSLCLWRVAQSGACKLQQRQQLRPRIGRRTGLMVCERPTLMATFSVHSWSSQ